MRFAKTFVKSHKRYRVVYTALTKERVIKALNMYDNKITAIHQFDRYWAIGVR